MKKKLGKWQGRMTQSLTGQSFDVSYEWAITSGGNTITERIVEDGVEMLTTYSDQDGELVVRHYCGLGTEPVFRLDELTDDSMSITVDEEQWSSPKAPQFCNRHEVDNGFKQLDKMVFENTVILDGEITNNRAELSRIL